MVVVVGVVIVIVNIIVGGAGYGWAIAAMVARLETEGAAAFVGWGMMMGVVFVGGHVVVGVLEGVEAELFWGWRYSDAGSFSLFAHGTVAFAVASATAVSAGSMDSSCQRPLYLLCLP